MSRIEAGILGALENEAGILGALENFEEMNQIAYDYWVSELYDVNGEKIADKWNADVLYEMEEDYVCLF